MAQIRAYEVVERYCERNRMSVSALARKAGVDERDFRRIMQTKPPTRRFSMQFVEKIFQATGGEVDRSLWIPS